MNLRNLCLLATLAAGLAACSSPTHVFVANTPNVPLLKEKNEFKGSVSTRNAAAAYAITDHIAVSANAQYLWGFRSGDRKDYYDDVYLKDYDSRGHGFEGAIGYFTAFGHKKLMVFDVYAGVGTGYGKTYEKTFYESPQDNTVKKDYLLETKYSKVFIQPSIGFVHRAVEIAFSPRFQVVNFYGAKAGRAAFYENEYDLKDFNRSVSRSIPMFQPTFTFRAGKKLVKFQMQYMFTLPVDDSGAYYAESSHRYYRFFTGDMGIAFNIAKWYNQTYSKSARAKRYRD
ncbi:hypothetical protein LX64_00451 [Chitinophaga skermanii]|uniref:Outer membrane protein with beta-barrel domain n=1 Tax=Chitinophaga skermanii TaxID=331697 RepID=A0A327R508_9BACT|nr:hypothetical protein [Chitinophaga skermanii]RAJ10844.1 hypothetical protein LX64_00451 [Chitinophaga skermanii]